MSLCLGTTPESVVQMTPEQFREWRKRLGLTREEAAEQLGISPSTVKAYELGRTRPQGEPLEIPKTVRLACGAVQNGYLEFAA